MVARHDEETGTRIGTADGSHPHGGNLETLVSACSNDYKSKYGEATIAEEMP
jgi:hypothetical protein